jgi:hypothetical protein
MSDFNASSRVRAVVCWSGTYGEQAVGGIASPKDGQQQAPMIHGGNRTCAHDSGMKVALLPVAAARASMVLLQPGGPCSSTPLGGDNPSRLKTSAAANTQGQNRNRSRSSSCMLCML